MSQNILSVSQINAYIQHNLDSDPYLSSVAVQGEISNYKLYPSGHHYFTIKDDSSALKCVMFRGNAIRLRFQPENGMKIIAIGRISVYPRDGAYQLYCTSLIADGVGDLHVAFEQLKTKLSAQGLFDTAHKKNLPAYPQTIALITSEAGAAVHDMLRILKRRWPLTKVVLLPVRVQGVEAPAEIAAAIRYANYYDLADLLIVGRGGGSIEDLWAFNDENVANAIFESTIPVISAVGHEPDITISDYVADVRAATPSNAAELAVPDQESLRQQLDAMQNSMTAIIRRKTQFYRNHLSVLSGSPSLRTPYQYIGNKRKTLQLYATAIESAQSRYVGDRRQQFIHLTAKLDALSPLKVLSRGYAMIQDSKKSVIKSVKQTAVGESIRITKSDGGIEATVNSLKGDVL